MDKTTLAAALVSAAALSLSACDVQETQDGKVVKAPDVNVSTTEKQVTVPKVEVTTEKKTVQVPKVTVTRPQEKEQQANSGANKQ